MNLSVHPPQHAPSDPELTLQVNTRMLVQLMNQSEHDGLRKWLQWLKHEYGATLVVHTNHMGMTQITGLKFHNLEDLTRFQLAWT